MAANPQQDPFLLDVDSKVVIPNQMLLPFISRKGIVINLPELRLYYFSPEESKVHVFPVGIGRQGLSTPLTSTVIGEKRKDPDWRPTKEMQERHFAEHGKYLPDVVPAGPNNPCPLSQSDTSREQRGGATRPRQTHTEQTQQQKTVRMRR